MSFVILYEANRIKVKNNTSINISGVDQYLHFPLESL